ncbi:helix-turn-helix protein [Novosphingobium taihuense]|nr:helix-turn-helix protein [Novosphingobium taihuense]
MEYWKPTAQLEGLISGYHLYSVKPPEGRTHRDVFQPAWFNLRILIDPDTHWQVQFDKHEAQRVPSVSLFGPSSTVCWSESYGGAVVGAGITPAGWARLSRSSAAGLANRVVAAREVLGTSVDALAQQLRSYAEPQDIPQIFDQWFLKHMDEPHRDEQLIKQLLSALLSPNLRSVSQLADELGLMSRTLERFCLKAFGFPPKVLIRRTRFLRSLHALIRGGPGRRALAIDAGYTDYSHFIREAHQFLGMKPTQFLEECGPMFLRSLDLRQAVLGAPAQALAEGTKT